MPSTWQAAYAFHLAESQCFFDGNKRTGVGSALMFLKLNDIPSHGAPEIERHLYDAIINIAKHELDKPRPRRPVAEGFLVGNSQENPEIRPRAFYLLRPCHQPDQRIDFPPLEISSP